MASTIVEQFTALGGFTLGYTLEDGIYREKFTPYVSERQRDILEARAALKGRPILPCDCYRPEGCAKCSKWQRRA